MCVRACTRARTCAYVCVYMYICVRVRRQVKYEGYVMRISNIKNQRRASQKNAFARSIPHSSLPRPNTETTRQTDRCIWMYMKSNVVFADVRYNWELSCDGFIVRGARRCAVAIFPQDPLIDLSKYRDSREGS